MQQLKRPQISQLDPASLRQAAEESMISASRYAQTDRVKSNERLQSHMTATMNSQRMMNPF